MYCTHCGSPLTPSNTFCTTCGTPRAPTFGGGVHYATPGMPPGPVPLGLRPLGAAERLDAALKSYFANFRNITRVVALIAVPFGVIEAIINYSSGENSPGLTTTTLPNGTTQLQTTDIWSRLAGDLSVLLISSIVSTLVIATVAVLVGAWYVGSPVAWREALRKSARRLPSTLLFLFYRYLAFLVIIAVAALPVIAFHDADVGAGAVLWGLLVGIGAFVAIVWIDISWKATVPTIMLEDLGAVRAMRRSFRLIKGTWWNVLGTIILAVLLTEVIAGFFGAILVVGILATRLDAVGFIIIDGIVNTAILILVTPFTAAVNVVVAIDMRVRKEGLDLEILARNVDVPAQPSAVPNVLTWGSGFPTLPDAPPDTSSGSFPPPTSAPGEDPDSR
jgi:hypothetical protein